ncbi:hypothetical protein OH747_40575 (plasmid) [Streptomyces anthocyanicus]|nr:hypothetical protein OH747_40575 [Streptomyces anthocyanicus]
MLNDQRRAAVDRGRAEGAAEPPAATMRSSSTLVNVSSVSSGSAAPRVPGAAEFAYPIAGLEEVQRLPPVDEVRTGIDQPDSHVVALRHAVGRHDAGVSADDHDHIRVPSHDVSLDSSGSSKEPPLTESCDSR